VLGHRLGAEHVQRRARDFSGIQRGLEILFHHQRAPGHVEHPDAVLALGQSIRVQPVLGVRGTGQVQREEVGRRVDPVRGGGLLHAQLAVALG